MVLETIPFDRSGIRAALINLKLIHPLGFEPRSRASKARILTIELWMRCLNYGRYILMSLEVIETSSQRCNRCVLPLNYKDYVLFKNLT